MAGDVDAAHEAERELRHRRAVVHARSSRERPNDARIGGFLKDDDVGIARADDGRQRVLAPRASPADVVGQEPERQSVSSTSVRYGWPSSSPRKYMTQSRVPWMLTGRRTIAISRSRSGTRRGAMSRSTSLRGREWMPGTQKPSRMK